MRGDDPGDVPLTPAAPQVSMASVDELSAFDSSAEGDYDQELCLKRERVFCTPRPEAMVAEPF
jgi:hypothetical protein